MLWDGTPVFLNGVNGAWLHYGNDFGGSLNGKGKAHACALQAILAKTSRHGGQAVRFWLHAEGDHTPSYDESGFVLPDSGSLLADLRLFLRAAEEVSLALTLTPTTESPILHP